MKAKSIFAATLLVAGAAFADSTTVETDYVLGVLPVAATNETIVAIPWIEPGGASTGVAVTNLIKTATLDVGDRLYWYNTDDGKYSVWTVAIEGGVKYWNGEPTVGDTGELDVVQGTNAVLNCGQALFLKRASNVSTNVYVVGQYTNVTGRTTAIKAKNGTNPTYTLLAPPYAEKLGDEAGYIDLNSSSINWGNANRADVIIVGLKTITLEDTSATGNIQDTFERGKNGSGEWKWGTYSKGVFTPTAKVPVGKGFWYKSYRSEDGTVTWN